MHIGYGKQSTTQIFNLIVYKLTKNDKFNSQIKLIQQDSILRLFVLRCCWYIYFSYLL